MAGKDANGNGKFKAEVPEVMHCGALRFNFKSVK
jgi:hypothetical protein